MALREWIQERITAPADQTEGMAATRWLFLRVLALLSLAAFISFHGQVHALIGEQGVDPLVDDLQEAREQYGVAFAHVPTLSFFLPDGGITILTVGGMIASILLFLDVAPLLMLLLLWLCYMSLVIDAGSAAWFFDDFLIIETLFLSMFLAPWTLFPAQERGEPQHLSVEAMRFLLFKLMFFAGLVKLFADNAFDNLTAMHFYFLTQPFPTPPAWFLHKLPLFMLSFLTAMVLVLELVLPYLIFAPRTYRIAGAYVLALLFLGIELTSNYGFLNILPIVLCILLLDDQHLSRLRSFLDDIIAPARSVPLGRVTAVLLALLLLLNIPVYMDRYWKVDLPDPVQQTVDVVSRFRTINTYSPYSGVPKRRYEYIIQGSMDNQTWKSYDFRYKPDELHEPPPVIPLHQPRLDDEVVDAAGEGNPYLMQALLDSLLEGEEPVEAQFATVPFDRPPEYLRVVRYRYRFSTWQGLIEEGRWWRRSGREVVLRQSSRHGTADRVHIFRDQWFVEYG